MEKKTLIGPFSQLLPMADLPMKGALKDEQLTIIKEGGILVSNGIIEAIGPFAALRPKADAVDLIQTDAVCLPGFIDAHTHICFGGSRAKDYAMRNAGKSYLEIAKAGGGIWDTVTKTRQETENSLVEGIKKRAQEHLLNGVTTIEVKSGYGLCVDEELKMLRAIKKADIQLEVDLIPTCLAAHMVPKDWKGTPEQYLIEMVSNLFPILKTEKLTNRIDAFVEESAFSASQIAPYFEKAKKEGFEITVHADQFSTGGSQVAVDFGAISADHLEASTEKEIEVLAQSDTTAMALPGASIGLGCNFTPARRLLDAGACLAIASDHNPGSAPMGDLLTQAAILGTFEKLSNAEVLAAITVRAASALNLKDRGILKKGQLADFAIFPTHNYQEITYHQGQLKPMMVYKNGQKVN